MPILGVCASCVLQAAASCALPHPVERCEAADRGCLPRQDVRERRVGGCGVEEDVRCDEYVGRSIHEAILLRSVAQLRVGTLRDAWLCA
jgi:hypothetical protein